MKTMYKTEVSRWGVSPKIETVDVVKETEKTVTILTRWKDYTGADRSREDRENKNTDHHQYHTTWEAAHCYLMIEADKRVKSLRMKLEQAKGTMGNIKGMKKPE
jgi:hypothetical protein